MVWRSGRTNTSKDEDERTVGELSGQTITAPRSFWGKKLILLSQIFVGHLLIYLSVIQGKETKKRGCAVWGCSSLMPPHLPVTWANGSLTASGHHKSQEGGGSWQQDSSLKLAPVPHIVSLCLIDSPHTAFMVSQQAKPVRLKSRAGTGRTSYGGSIRLANSGNHWGGGVSSFTYSHSWDACDGQTMQIWRRHSNRSNRWAAGRLWCFYDVRMTREKGGVEMKDADGWRKDSRSMEPRKTMLRRLMMHCVPAGIQRQTRQRKCAEQIPLYLSLSGTFKGT